MEENINTEVQTSIDTYQKEVELPSKGYFGGPEKVVIRAMTTAEEKILYSAKDFSFIKKICRACTVNPKNLDTNKLSPQDLSHMLFQIRELTFGSTYEQPVICPYCRMRQNAVIDITRFEYTLLESDVESKLFIELPISKAKVQLKLLSQDEIDSIEDKAKRMFADNKISDLDGYIFVCKLCAMISYIEGMEFKTDLDKLSYVNKMHAMDTNAIRNKLNEFDFGLKTNINVVCQNHDCEKEIEVLGTVCPEFFRPSK